MVFFLTGPSNEQYSDDAEFVGQSAGTARMGSLLLVRFRELKFRILKPFMQIYGKFSLLYTQIFSLIRFDFRCQNLLRLLKQIPTRFNSHKNSNYPSILLLNQAKNSTPCFFFFYRVWVNGTKPTMLYNWKSPKPNRPTNVADSRPKTEKFRYTWNFRLYISNQKNVWIFLLENVFFMLFSPVRHRRTQTQSFSMTRLRFGYLRR